MCRSIHVPRCYFGLVYILLCVCSHIIYRCARMSFTFVFISCLCVLVCVLVWVYFVCCVTYSIHVLCPARYAQRDIMFPGCPSVLPSFHHSVCHVLGVPLCVQRPAKTLLFQQIIMHALQCQHDIEVHLLFCVDLDLHITSPEVVFNLVIFSSILTDGYHFACSAPQKLCLFNKLSCMHCNANMT